MAPVCGGAALAVDFVLYMFLSWGMTILLRKQGAQARVEGREPFGWRDDDYAVVEDTVIGRIYKETIHGQPKWMWFLQYIPGTRPGGPVPPPNTGMADSLDEAKAAFARRYDEAKKAR
jgi:hypothetical protein